jgi:cation transport regulator
MPYQQVTQLPSGVKNSLPKHAQDIYKEAYNSAWDQYSDRDKSEREEVAHRTAWSAVKKKYERVSSGDWRRRQDSS